jgi:uncharacterized protein (TIGR00730 family)
MVQDVVERVETTDADLLREMMTTTLRLVRQRASRAELKMVNAAMKEFAYSFRVFAPYQHLPKVSIFGSARVMPGDPEYIAARDFAREMASRGWMVITGAGPGIMAAGHEGAGASQSFGANIRLPFLNPANVYIARDGKLINFKYFFTRKVTFMKESKAFVLLPGGWGTLDETFELLTLVQTGKSDLHPIVLLEAEGTEYWGPMIEFITNQQLARGLISESDLNLFFFTTDQKAAAEHIWHFYGNYHSQRYSGGKLVLRLNEEPSDETLERLNQEFADIIVEGRIERAAATAAEMEDSDALHLHRIAFVFDRRSFGRLRAMIDSLNDLVAAPRPSHLPEPMTEEHAERPW